MTETSTCVKCGQVVTDNELPDCPHGLDPELVVVHDGPPKRFPRVAAELVERRNKITWLMGGVEVLEYLGDNTYRVIPWHRATIEDLERLFYVIGELLINTQPQTQSKGQ